MKVSSGGRRIDNKHESNCVIYFMIYDSTYLLDDESEVLEGDGRAPLDEDLVQRLRLDVAAPVVVVLLNVVLHLLEALAQRVA